MSYTAKDAKRQQALSDKEDKDFSEFLERFPSDRIIKALSEQATIRANDESRSPLSRRADYFLANGLRATLERYEGIMMELDDQA
jgi:hypothetical protein